MILQSYSNSRIAFGERLGTHTQADWLSIRQMRNKCTQAIRKAKVSYFKEQFSLCTRSCTRSSVKQLKTWRIKPSSQLRMSLKVDDAVVTDKNRMAEFFNHYFINSGFLFDSAMPPCPSNISSSATPFNVTIPDASPSYPLPCRQSRSQRC